MIASTVAPGAMPDQGIWQDSSLKIYPCSIYDRRFRDKHQVRSHMAFCVSKNGNPTGARWNDGWALANTNAAPLVAMPAVAMPVAAPPA